MRFLSQFKGREQDIIDLFAATFSASEGPQQGSLIEDLVRNLLGDTAQNDLFVFTAEENGKLAGGIIFSRMRYDEDARIVFILAPVAVATDVQARGIGQKLVLHGLNVLREAGIDIVLVYGDPKFYSKVGFTQISESVAPSPFKLSMPFGWQGQSLTATALAPLRGSPRCAEALNDASFW